MRLCIEKCLFHAGMKRKGEGQKLFKGGNAREIACWGILLAVRKPGIPYAVNDSHVPAYPGLLCGENLIDISDPVLRRGDAILVDKGLDCSHVLGLYLLGELIDTSHRAQRIVDFLFEHLRESQGYGAKVLFLSKAQKASADLDRLSINPTTSLVHKSFRFNRI